MKPDWDKLGDAYSNSESVLIVDVDCTAAGQGVCGKVGVRGYPTIKYYVAGDKKGKDYQGGRDFSSLKSFVESKLDKPACNVETLKGCKANEVTFIEKMREKSAAELKEEVTAKADALKQNKKAQAEAEKEHKAKMKEFKKEELKITAASAILKKLQKVAAKGAKTEL
mmetsp:Transcript_28639/g.80660  ORF Transcript_28639/g.80660 Transcript_28639/m.80660 type:complete len:168 (-) Transcript_28639:777-1280(-)